MLLRWFQRLSSNRRFSFGLLNKHFSMSDSFGTSSSYKQARISADKSRLWCCSFYSWKRLRPSASKQDNLSPGVLQYSSISLLVLLLLLLLLLLLMLPLLLQWRSICCHFRCSIVVVAIVVVLVPLIYFVVHIALDFVIEFFGADLLFVHYL